MDLKESLKLAMRILKTNLAQLHQINYAKNIFAVSRGLSRCMTSCNTSTPITDEYIDHKGEKSSLSRD